MRIEKGLLPFTRIEADKVFAGIFAAHAEKLQTNSLSRQNRRCRAPVNLRFAAGIRFTRNKRLSGRIKTQLQSRHPHITANGGFPASVTMFNPQSVINPSRRVPLLLRLFFVFLAIP